MPWVGVAVLGLAAALRLVALDGVPPGLQHDEVFKTIFVEQVRAGDYPIFFDLNGGNEPFFAYLTTVSLALLGENVIALRLPAVAGGLIGIAATWRIGRRLWGPPVAIMATLLMAVSLWHLMDSRVSLRAIWLPAFMATGYAFLWRGIGTGRARWYLLGALVLGLSLYTYSSAALGIAALGLFGVLMAFRGERRTAAALLAATALALIMGLPLLLHWRQVPEAGLRVRDLNHEIAALRDGDPLPVLRSAVRVAGMLAFVGDPEWRYNVAGRPVFTLPIGLAAYYGLWLCWRRRADPRYLFLALWALVNLAASAVTGSSPSTLRAVGAMPAIFLLAAAGCLEAYRRLFARSNARLATAVLGVALAAEAALGLHAYFFTWPDRPEVRDIYRADLADIARSVGRSSLEGPVLVSTEYAADLDRLSFEYLGFTDARPRYFDGSDVLLLPAEPAMLYVPTSRPLSPSLQAALAAHGSLVQEKDSFRAWTVAPATEALGAPLAEVLAPWPGPALRVIAVDMPPEAKGGSSIEIVAQFEVSAAAPGGRSVTVFAHLVDGAGFLWAQTDALTYPTSDWRVGDTVYQVLTLEVPADMPAVVGTVELGFYEDAGRPYTLLLGEGRLPFTRLDAGEIRVRAAGSPISEIDAELAIDGLLPAGHLVGGSVGPRVVQPGQPIEVSLWWEAADLAAVGNVGAEIRGEGYAQALSLEAVSGEGAAGAGGVLQQRLRFAVPADSPRGEWDLALLVNGAPDGVSLGRVFVAGVERDFEAPPVALLADAVFDHSARLLGCAQGIEPVRAGDNLDLDLLWQAEARFAHNYTVFVHLTDAAGRVWASHDAWPAEGARPTRGWLTGEVVRDHHRIAVPVDAPPGTYRLIAGMYEGDDVGYPRLPVSEASTEAGPNWALISEIEVVE